MISSPPGILGSVGTTLLARGKQDYRRPVPTFNASNPILALATAALLACAGVGVAAVGRSRSSLVLGITAVLIAGIAAALAVCASRQTRHIGVFLPLSFIGLWVLGYGLASLTWRNPDAELLVYNARQLDQESLPLGLAAATVGLLAWAAGYVFLKIRLIRTLVSPVRRWSTPGVVTPGRSDYSLVRIFVVYGVGIAARLTLLLLGRYSYITTDLQGAITQSSPLAAALSQLEFFTSVGLLLLAYTYFRTPTTAARTVLIGAVVLEIPFGLLSGMRSFLLLRLIGVFVTYVLVRRRVPPIALIALLCVLALLSPFTEAYRDEVRGATGTTVGPTAAAQLIPTLLSSTVREFSPGDLLSGPADFVTGRLRFVDELAIVSQRTPSEFSYIPASDTVIETTTALIPRAVWAGKPVYVSGLQYARDFWRQPVSIISSRSPTYPGDAYYRGGWIALVVLMALLGGVMAAINSSLSPQLYTPAIPMFVIAWTGMINIEGSLSLLGAGLVQSLLVTAVAMRWASRARRSPGRRSLLVVASTDRRSELPGAI